MDTEFDDALSKCQKKLGQHIKYLRKQKHWSQDDLSSNSGLTKAYLSTLERGIGKPGIESLLKLAISFDISLHELFLFPDEEFDNTDLKARIKRLVDDMDNNITPQMMASDLIKFFMQQS